MKLISFLVVTAVFTLLFQAALFAVPPTEKVIQKLKDEGRFDEFVQSMIEARANGYNTPLADDGKGVASFTLEAQSEFRVLVILIDFPNKPYTSGWAAPLPADFDSLLFSENLNPTGSMSEFYYENSYGNFVMVGDVVGWYRADNSSDYYTNFCDGSHGLGSYPYNARRLVEEAVDLADPDVDFSLYDNDQNGYVDGIFVVHAGTGYEESGNDCEIHSHKSSISARYKDGVYVTTYSIEPEESSGNQDMIPIGVFCHEFGHVLGLPDLYDTDYSSRGCGRWALMASGSYNGQSKVPSQFISWSKAALGWMTLTNVTENMTDVEIPAVEWNPVAYRLWRYGQGGAQYFIVENRQEVGFDSYLPGHGLLIWHIDDNVWGNTNDWHPKVFLEQADGKFDLQNDNNSGDGSDAYPNSGYSPHFHDKTTPDSRDYNLASTEVAVWDISNSDSIMTADFDISWSRPYLYFLGYSFSDAAGGDGDGFLENGETIEFTATIANDWKAANSATMTLSVDDATLIITNGTAFLGTIPSGGSADNNLDPLEFEIPIDYSARLDSFFLTIESDGGQFSIVLPIEQNVGQPAALLIDDDNGDDLDEYYTSGFYEKRIPYDLWDKSVSGSPDAADLNNYDAVIWFTGDYRADPLNGSDINAMKAFIDAGNNLFITGQGIAAQLSSLDPAFLSNYLKAEYVSTVRLPVLMPTPEAQVLNDMDTVVIQSYGGASNQTDPDQIDTANGSVPELEYLTLSEYGALSYSGSYRLVFFGFGFEAVASSESRFEKRENVFGRILDFFDISASSGYPEVIGIGIGPGDIMHMIDPNPTISWEYYDEGALPQQAYQVQVGTDDDWSVAETWDPGQMAGDDTSVVYSGDALSDGQTYFVRVRVNNGVQWSGWGQSLFRMNSRPSAPYNLTPDGMEAVITVMPELQHQNSADNEGDILFYSYEVYDDSLMTILVADTTGLMQGPSITSWTVDSPLSEDADFFWRARAYDGYQYGEWSQPASFWTNSDNQLPTAFDLIVPADGLILTEMLPTFSWDPSTDADLYDLVNYSLYYSTDSGFAASDSVVGLSDTNCTLTDSLSFGSYYYWKVTANDDFGGITTSDKQSSFFTWMLGDANSDRGVDVADAVYIINYIFKDGPAPDPLKVGDMNQDCGCNVADAVYLINYVFKDGPSPMIGCQ